MEKIDERTFKFALRIVKLVGALPRTMQGEILGRQVLRSGTSIGAISKRHMAAHPNAILPTKCPLLSKRRVKRIFGSV